MTRTRTFLMLLLAFLVAAIAGTSAAAQDELNCDDFATQADAQAELEADPSDPNRLDADGDGQACETFFADDGDGALDGDGDDGDGALDGDEDDGAGALDGSSDSAMPTGGVATGGGGTADTSPGPLATAAALLAALGAFVIAGRAAIGRR